MMIKKINDLLAGLPMTILGGLLLIPSLFLPRLGISLPVDPAWGTVVICGIPLLYLAIWRIIYNPGISKISSALLISIAMFAAIAIGDLFAAGEVAFIMAIGAILEDMTTERAKKGLKKLISLTPTQGRKITNGTEEMIDANLICKDDIVRVLPGETIPVDGIIVSGETSIDQSIMTGESLPVDKTTGDSAFCGTLNRFGSVDIRATKVGEDSSLQKLIRMVQEAEEKKAPMARIADKAASYLVPIALLIAIVAGLVTHDIVRAVTVLVVFCPCALVLATPTAIMAAIGQATKHGVIIKSGEALEKMGRVDTITFDKTGTLTYGQLQVSDIVSFDSDIDNDALLYIAACAEAKSEHPLGKAIVAFAKEKNMSLTECTSFSMTSGRGIRATLAIPTSRALSNGVTSEQDIRRALSNGVTLEQDIRRTLSNFVTKEQETEHALSSDVTQEQETSRTLSNFVTQAPSTIFCGNEAYLLDNGLTLSNEVQTSMETLRAQGKASIIVADSEKCIGIIALSDVIRPDAKHIISRLLDMNTKTVLLTGDNEKTAHYFADKVGIKKQDVFADLLPEQKVNLIVKFQEEGKNVCMIGDGVNDAPSLKTASVGVAMGGIGSDIAVEAADIALMSDDISKIPYLKRLSNATVRTIKGSICLSMCINFLAIVLSVLGLLTPTTGALVHNAGSCFVVLIAALLYDRKFE